MRKILILSAVSLTICVTLIDALHSSKKTIDVVDYDTWKDESIVESLCGNQMSGKSTEISRISTISWLYEYFHSLAWAKISPHAPMSQCFGQFRDPLEKLQSIISIGQNNACDDAKIGLIEEFHRNYILSSGNRGESNGYAIPEPLRLFFMRYSVEVMEACKWSLIRNLELSHDYFDVRGILNGGGFGKLIELMQNYFGAPNMIGDFDDFVLIWDMIDDYGRRVGDLPPQLARDPVTGQRSGMMVKVRSAGGLLALQAECRNSLRPIYGPLVLPVMRLASLGYHLRREPSQIATNQLAQDWYKIAQACEALLPLGVFEDIYLESGKAEMITPEEAAQLVNSGIEGTQIALLESPIQFYFDTSVLAGIDQLESVFHLDPRDLIGEVQHNIKIRRQYLRRLIKQLSLQFKDKLKSKLGDFSMSSRARKAQSQSGTLTGGGGDGALLSANSLDGDYLDEDYLNENEMINGYNHPDQLNRMKRALFSSSRRRRKENGNANGLEFPEQRRTLRQKVKRVAIISILMAVISALVFILVWFSRG